MSHSRRPYRSQILYVNLIYMLLRFVILPYGSFIFLLALLEPLTLPLRCIVVLDTHAISGASFFNYLSESSI